MLGWLRYLLRQNNYNNVRLVEVLSNVVFEQCLVFSNYQNGAEEVGVCLTREGFSNQLIAGSMLQKDRTQAMTDFRECRFFSTYMITFVVSLRLISIANLKFDIYDVIYSNK